MKEMFRCPKCKSSQTRCRIKTGERICYACGNIWSVNPEVEKDG